MMRIAIAMAAAALLAGCQQPPATGNETNGAAGIDPAQPAAVTSAHSAAEGESIAEEQRKAANAEAFAWTGRFAASRELCTSGGVWDIGRSRIVTQGETSCDVEAVREDGRGTVELDLQCIAEGMRSRERWTLVRQAERIRLTRAPEGGEAHTLDMLRCG